MSQNSMMEIVNSELLVRRMNVVANHVTRQEDVVEKKEFEQLDLLRIMASLKSRSRKKKICLLKRKGCRKL